MRELGQSAGQLHTGWAGAHHDACQQAFPSLPVGLHLRALVGKQNAPADRLRILDGLQRRRNARPMIVTEIVVFRSGGDDEEIITELGAGSSARLARHTVDSDHFVEQHARVRLVPQQASNGNGDIRRRKRRGGDLIQQRLEQMEVAPVDHGDRGACRTELLGNSKPAETCPDDEDARNRYARRRLRIHVTRTS